MATIKQRTLMNKEYLAEYSLLPKNYSIDEVWNFIPIAEQLHIVPIIGMKMYNQLLDEVEQNNVDPANASLLLQIYPLEGLAIVETAMPYLAYRVNEAGITKNSSENSEPLTVNELNYLTNYVRSQITPYKQKLEQFIQDNSELYPLIPKQEVCKQRTSGRVYGFNQINTDVDNNKLINGTITSNIIDSIWRYN